MSIYFVSAPVSEFIHTETSSPLSFSSTTILLPAEPYFLSPKISSTAAHASSLLLATTTPFPAANPLALTTSASYVALNMIISIYENEQEREREKKHQQFHFKKNKIKEKNF